MYSVSMVSSIKVNLHCPQKNIRYAVKVLEETQIQIEKKYLKASSVKLSWGLH
jgi:hypothetical protein